ncbi:hypothetical protein Tdes44962_MAKER08047 [Teratosphaeria destructans]|uniref:Uncharacterized protein n=1 Tax=Teratosphaeria destructans TaxID=418781 RepID=A0A9W7SXK4_9PEZI|nr:hypothetical protein Tdes44962_MAKER08047 [Teratosphaeria destructans]
MTSTASRLTKNGAGRLDLDAKGHEHRSDFDEFKVSNDRLLSPSVPSRGAKTASPQQLPSTPCQPLFPWNSSGAADICAPPYIDT